MIETNKIYQEDILDVLGMIPDGFVDLVVTDPPFNDGIDYGVSKDNRPDYWEWIEKCIDEFKRISRNRVVMLVRGDKLIEFLNIFSSHLVTIHESDFIFYLLVSDSFQDEGSWFHSNEDNFILDKIRYKNHGLTSLPLMKRIVRSYSYCNGIVLDGFMGCGTTAVACQNLGRRYIGIELNPDYIEISKQRLAEARRE